MRQHLASTIIAYGLALGAGFAFHFMAIPLAWLLGPLLMSAALSLSGVPINAPQMPRKLGQVTIGATVGLNVTSEILGQLVSWLPVMLASSLFSVLASAGISVLLARWALIDTKSAYFASLPGGLSEMANVGVSAGAAPEPIAIVQTVRVGLIVLAVPPLLFHFGIPAHSSGPTTPEIPLVWVPVLLGGGTILALLFGLVRLNNPWMIGATVFAATLSALELVGGHMPQPVFQAAQYLIGFAVGSRFRPFMIRKLPRVTFYGLISVGLLGLTMMTFAALLAIVTGIDITTAILATSPGGTAEMTATAQVLHLAVATVVAFQVVRALTVNALALHLWNALSHVGFFSRLERWIGK